MSDRRGNDAGGPSAAVGDPGRGGAPAAAAGPSAAPDAATASAPIVIVGAGQAGLQLAEALRTEGWAGGIVLLGDEPHAPYHRPPLSKAYLLGESTAEQLAMRGPDALARKGIALRTGVRVERVDRAARTVRLAGGEVLAYSKLALATGARPRTLPGTDFDGVFQLRTLDDCHRIHDALERAADVAVIGGGFIGLEFAAAARKLGRRVTVIEVAPRLMGRAVSPWISDWYAALHRERGVQLHLGARIESFDAPAGRVRAIRLAGGSAVAADLVVLGVGVDANAELAAAAGLEVDRGVVVDACSRTADPFVFACGDCTIQRLPDGSLRRLESVQNAVEQAKAAAAAMTGRDKPFAATPWFWSDQYDVKLQMVGTSAGHDRMVVRGDPAERRFSLFYYRDGRLIGIDSVNRPQEHVLGRKLLDRALTPTPEQAADAAFRLDALLAG